jgi:hypothetical protein
VIALALGGSALAQAGGTTTTPPAATSTAPSVETTPVSGSRGHAKPIRAQTAQKPDSADTDHIQSGDQSAADTPGGAGESETGQEAPESAQEGGSEVPGDDGPGGHADEPGNSNADHQFEGTE